MAVRDIYLKIETIPGYSPVEPDDHVSPPIQYRRDCMRNMGHEDGTIPDDEVAGRRPTALIYREYLDPDYLVPKPDKLVAADINEPAFSRRVPGTVIYARPGDWLRIHVKNTDGVPHSFHVHGVRYGIDSDGSWPFGTQSSDGRRSDEICPGQQWTYTFEITEDTVGAWPFHDHYRQIGAAVNRGRMRPSRRQNPGICCTCRCSSPRRQMDRHLTRPPNAGSGGSAKSSVSGISVCRFSRVIPSRIK